MARYVDLDAVVELLENQWGYEGMREELYAIPEADVAPVRHGRWIAGNNRMGIYARCSVCGFATRGFAPDYRYCPNCGARMDGGTDNDTEI